MVIWKMSFQIYMKKYFEYNKLDEIESTISYVKLEKLMMCLTVVGNFPYEKKLKEKLNQT